MDLNQLLQSFLSKIFFHIFSVPANNTFSQEHPYCFSVTFAFYLPVSQTFFLSHISFFFSGQNLTYWILFYSMTLLSEKLLHKTSQPTTKKLFFCCQNFITPLISFMSGFKIDCSLFCLSLKGLTYFMSEIAHY